MTVRDRIHNVLAEAFGKPAPFIRDEHTLADLGDSLEFIDAVLVLEDAFGIDITQAEYDATRTVRDVVALVEAKLAPPRAEVVDLMEALKASLAKKGGAR